MRAFSNGQWLPYPSQERDSWHHASSAWYKWILQTQHSANNNMGNIRWSFFSFLSHPVCGLLEPLFLRNQQHLQQHWKLVFTTKPSDCLCDIKWHKDIYRKTSYGKWPWLHCRLLRSMEKLKSWLRYMTGLATATWKFRWVLWEDWETNSSQHHGTSGEHASFV